MGAVLRPGNMPVGREPAAHALTRVRHERLVDRSHKDHSPYSAKIVSWTIERKVFLVIQSNVCSTYRPQSLVIHCYKIKNLLPATTCARRFTGLRCVT